MPFYFAGPYQGYYQTALMKQQCIESISVESALQSASLNCNPPWLPLNGSTFLQYNSTTYNDDMAWAATWMYRCAVHWRTCCFVNGTDTSSVACWERGYRSKEWLRCCANCSGVLWLGRGAAIWC